MKAIFLRFKQHKPPYEHIIVHHLFSCKQKCVNTLRITKTLRCNSYDFFYALLCLLCCILVRIYGELTETSKLGLKCHEFNPTLPNAVLIFNTNYFSRAVGSIEFNILLRVQNVKL